MKIMQRKFAGLVSSMAVALVAMLAFSAPAYAVLKIDITRGTVAPMPIAIPPLNGANAQDQEYGANVSNVVMADLKRSGLFRAVDRRAYIQDPATIKLEPRFGDWRQIDAQALVTGRTTMEADGRLKVEFRLWDTFAGKQMAGLVYFTQPENWRRIAHLVSDAIYNRMTGESGYFDTRIVYVAESGPKIRRVKRLAIMDQDGANHRYLTHGQHLVLTPRFSPTNQEITYLSYYRNQPRVYIFNLETGQQEVLGDFPDMTFAPRFSPDGKKVILSLARGGNTDVYVMDLSTRVLRQLTRHPAIDTAASFSADGSHITFSSDRSGSKQIYVMRANGTDIKRISFGKGTYETPVWSPRGDLIAFTHSSRGKYHIGVMRPDGKGQRLLTESFLDEGPTWAPNGRVLMFFRQVPTNRAGQGGSVKLWSVDLTGHNERPVPTPGHASDPAWSPLINK